MAASSEFYATTAQIIPVLVLLFAVQNRETLTTRSFPGHASSDVLVGLSVCMIGLILGEAAALAGLLGVDSTWWPFLIVGSIGIAVQQVITPFIKASRKKLVAEAKGDAEYWSLREDRITTYFSVVLSYIAQYVPMAITLVAAILLLPRF